ncbi:MAG: alkaline phosphatase [Bacteroidales bacterium]|nr:alkaline phosphatase [Bacteroidales bacterium]
MKTRLIINFILIVIISIACNKRDTDVTLVPSDNKKPLKGKNLILLIGDGMGLAQITAARTVNGGNLNMLTCNSIGIQSTHAADKYVTDSGASATAMACGHKTNYYSLGVDTDGNPLENIIEVALINELKTGLITTATVVHATPAAFYAHQVDRFQYEAIALELVDHQVDFFAGGGQIYFDQRSDGLNLVDTLLQSGYKVSNQLGDVDPGKKNAVIIADGYPVKYSEGRGDFLSNSLDIALQILSKDERGFFLMVEGAQIDWACEENDQDYLIDEMLDFDKAVGIALDFAKSDKNTLVVITGDHETGGYALVDGDVINQVVDGQFVTFLHTGSMIPVFAYGPEEEMFTGVYENTEFFYKFLDFYNFQE